MLNFSDVIYKEENENIKTDRHVKSHINPSDTSDTDGIVAVQ